MNSRKMLLFGLLILLALVLAGCAGQAGEPGPVGAVGPAGPQGPAGAAPSEADLACTDCHNDTSTLFVARQQWEESMHNTGDAFGRGTSSSCAGCHSSEGFSAMVAAGITADKVEEAPAVSSKTNCRTCHEIHTTYTGADFALTTTDPVMLYASGETYDAGKSNLCVNFHQPRRPIDASVDGMITITSTHWGPHHGPQSTMLLGLGGAGVEGSPSAHAQMVEDGCVTCHMGEADDHSMEPAISACTGCHADIEDFDVNGLQAEVEALAAELGEKLEAAGLLHDGHPNPGTYPEAQAWAAWNWIYITLEDSSSGVHNPAFTKAMLEAGLAAFE